MTSLPATIPTDGRERVLATLREAILSSDCRVRRDRIDYEDVEDVRAGQCGGEIRTPRRVFSGRASDVEIEFYVPLHDMPRDWREMEPGAPLAGYGTWWSVKGPKGTTLSLGPATISDILGDAIRVRVLEALEDHDVPDPAMPAGAAVSFCLYATTPRVDPRGFIWRGWCDVTIET